MESRDLIYKDECYKVVGLAFNVYNNIGYGHREAFYEKALVEEFRETNVSFQEQLRMVYDIKES